MAENLTTVGELRNRLADFSDTAQVSVRVGDQFYLIDGVNDVGGGKSVFLNVRDTAASHKRHWEA